ncbi:MAG: hypothetical protein AAF074_01945 [Pseudomonadota bacterium]
MSGPAEPRGGAPVAILTDLPPLQASAILYMRLWCSGPERQAQMWNDFTCRFGATEARERLCAFESLLTLITANARRPIMRHTLHCRCVGADEAVWANLIASAADGDEADARLFAALLVRPAIAEAVAEQARDVSRAICACARCGGATVRPVAEGAPPAPGIPDPSSPTRH